MKTTLIYTILFSFLFSYYVRSNNGFTLPPAEENQAWFGVYLKGQKNKFIFLTDIQIRKLLDFSQWRTIALRTGVFYKHGKGFKSGTGVAEFSSAINGEFRFRTEFRIWQETGHELKVKRFTFSNKFRFEQRWIENTGEKFDFYFRGRLKNEIGIRINGEENEKGCLQIQIANEFFVQGSTSKNVLIDQDRIYSSLSYTLVKGFTIQPQYIFIPYIKRQNGNTQHQNIIRLNLLFDF